MSDMPLLNCAGNGLRIIDFSGLHVFFILPCYISGLKESRKMRTVLAAGSGFVSRPGK